MHTIFSDIHIDINIDAETVDVKARAEGKCGQFVIAGTIPAAEIEGRVRKKAKGTDLFQAIMLAVFADPLFKKAGARGGRQAVNSRIQTRKQVAEEIKKYILTRHIWGDLTQTIESVTDTIWADMKAAIDGDKGWHGISSEDLRQARVGRQSVYDAIEGPAR